jgi:hypothetical protein
MGFILLQVVNFIIDIFSHKITASIFGAVAEDYLTVELLSFGD